jgi:hypothetical protein
MLKKVALAVGLAAMVVVAAGTVAFAQGIGNTCNAGVTKALAKKMKCRLGVYAQGQKKGVAPDSTKLATCDSKFSAACSKANSKGVCDAGHADCAGKESAADTCSASLAASPSGAFLN